MTKRTRITLLLVIIAILFGSLPFLPRIPQPPEYHNFADHRPWLGVPNFANALSNLPFAVFGFMGLWFLGSVAARNSFIDARERWPYITFFAGLALTAIGSGCYHLHPENATLLWDRLPMTVAFSGLVTAMVAERISVTLAIRILLPTLFIGITSPVQWYVSELQSQGDLRFYAAVQASAVLSLLLFLLLFQPRYTRNADFALVAVFYVLAKLFETFDHQIYSVGGLVSGHTLKHLAAALSGYWILRMLKLRKPLQQA